MRKAASVCKYSPSLRTQLTPRHPDVVIGRIFKENNESCLYRALDKPHLAADNGLVKPAEHLLKSAGAYLGFIKAENVISFTLKSTV